jgi:uncharacterized membrane protein
MDEPTSVPPPPPPDAPDTPNGPDDPTAADNPPPESKNDNRGIMIVLSYLWILALVPFLVETEDQDIRWHAKHGLVLFGAEVILFIVLSVLMSIPVVGCFVAIVWLVISLGVLVLHVVCIVKGIQGKRFLIPQISQFADKF